MLLIVFVICFIYKVANNLMNIYLTNHYECIFKKYSTNNCHKLLQYKSSIISLLKRACIKEPFIDRTEQIAYKYYKRSTVSVFENMLLNNRTKEIMFNSFEVAKGYYKARFLESFNPIYWINIIIFCLKKF